MWVLAQGDGLTQWLLVRGRGTKPLEACVEPARIRAHSSSKRPSVQRGDTAILYASVWQAVFAVVDVVGDPEHDPSRERWSWTFAIEPVVVVRDLHDAPPVEAGGHLPAEPLAALAHPPEARAVRLGPCVDRDRRGVATRAGDGRGRGAGREPRRASAPQAARRAAGAARRRMQTSCPQDVRGRSDLP